MDVRRPSWTGDSLCHALAVAFEGRCRLICERSRSTEIAVYVFGLFDSRPVYIGLLVAVVPLAGSACQAPRSTFDQVR